MKEVLCTETKRRLHDLALDRIESYSVWIRSDAENIERYAGMLLNKEPFRTKMESALEEAIKAMDETKARCERLLKEYRDMPVYSEAAE